MAAPTLVGSPIEASFSAANPWTIAITGGFTAGNTVVVMLAEAQSTNRDVTSITDGAGNVYGYCISVNPTNSPAAHAHILKCENIAAVPPGATLTVNLDGGCSGRLLVQELTTCTEDTSQRDGQASATSTTSMLCGAGNFTTPNNAIVMCAGATNGTGTLTAGTGFTKLGASISQSHFQFRRDTTGAATNNGPFNSSIARGYAGAMTSFVTPATATSFPPVLLNQRPRFLTRRRYQ